LTDNLIKKYCHTVCDPHSLSTTHHFSVLCREDQAAPKGRHSVESAEAVGWRRWSRLRRGEEQTRRRCAERSARGRGKGTTSKHFSTDSLKALFGEAPKEEEKKKELDEDDYEPGQLTSPSAPFLSSYFCRVFVGEHGRHEHLRFRSLRNLSQGVPLHLRQVPRPLLSRSVSRHAIPSP
jgi:hypothetical protein